MSHDEQLVLRAAAVVTDGRIQLVRYSEIADQAGITESEATGIAGRLQSQGLCMATFGGLQLTASGAVAANDG